MISGSRRCNFFSAHIINCYGYTYVRIEGKLDVKFAVFVHVPNLHRFVNNALVLIFVSITEKNDKKQINI